MTQVARSDSWKSEICLRILPHRGIELSASIVSGLGWIAVGTASVVGGMNKTVGRKFGPAERFSKRLDVHLDRTDADHQNQNSIP